MSIKFVAPISLEFNELRNFRVQNLASLPAGLSGQVVYNGGRICFHNGTSWISLGDLSQITAPSAAVAFNNQRLTSLGTPTAGQDATTKQYVDDAIAAAIQGYKQKFVMVATTANITLSGLQTIDGYTVVAGDEVLVMNQTAPAQNGIYVAATGAWSRSPNADTWSENVNILVSVARGTTNGNVIWYSNAPTAGTLGTTAITFSQWMRATEYTAGNGLTRTGNAFSVNAVSSQFEFSGGALQIKAGGVGTTQYADGSVTLAKLANLPAYSIIANSTASDGVPTAVAVTAFIFGLFASANAAAARAHIEAAQAPYTINIGNGSATDFTITHNRNTRNVKVVVRENASPWAEVFTINEATTVNTVTVRFSTPPTTNQYTVTVF